MRFLKLPLDREEMIRGLRAMANDLENGGVYTKGTLQFKTVGSDQVTAIYSVTGSWRKDKCNN